MIKDASGEDTKVRRVARSEHLRKASQTSGFARTRFVAKELVHSSLMHYEHPLHIAGDVHWAETRPAGAFSVQGLARHILVGDRMSLSLVIESCWSSMFISTSTRGLTATRADICEYSSHAGVV